MKTVPYTVKIDADLKEKWQEMVNSIMEERGFSTMGEVYPVLMDIISSNTEVTSADLSGYINTIRANLDSVLKNVLAIDSIYKSTQENNEQILNDAKSSLVSQLEKVVEENKAKNVELEKAREELAEAKKLIETLQTENKQLKDDQEIRQAILDALPAIRELKESNSKKTTRKTQKKSE